MAESDDGEARYEAEVHRHLKRNFIAHLLHGCLGQTGFRLLNAPTFLPAYILLLSDSDVYVAVALAAQSLGMAMTPLFAANLVEHRVRVLGVALGIGALARLCVLAIALAGLLFQPELALVTIIVALVAFGMFQGMQGVAFHFLMSKVIPVSKRGRLQGLRNFTAGIVSAAVAYYGGLYFLGEAPSATGYSQIFLLAFVLTSLGLALLTWMKEPAPPRMRAKSSLHAVWGRIPQLLSNHKPYRRFVTARALATAGRLAMPFYILYAADHLALNGTNLAVLTIAFTLAGNLSNLLWGVMADRRGFRIVYLASIALWVASTLLLMVSEDLWLTCLVFIGIGSAVQGFQVAAASLVLEFGSREDLPMRIAIANTGSELVGTVATLAAGFIAAGFGYEAVFIVSILFLAIGGWQVRRHVPEPRFGR